MQRKNFKLAGSQIVLENNQPIDAREILWALQPVMKAFPKYSLFPYPDKVNPSLVFFVCYQADQSQAALDSAFQSVMNAYHPTTIKNTVVAPVTQPITSKNKSPYQQPIATEEITLARKVYDVKTGNFSLYFAPLKDSFRANVEEIFKWEIRSKNFTTTSMENLLTKAVNDIQRKGKAEMGNAFKFPFRVSIYQLRYFYLVSDNSNDRPDDQAFIAAFKKIMTAMQHMENEKKERRQTVKAANTASKASFFLQTSTTAQKPVDSQLIEHTNPTSLSDQPFKSLVMAEIIDFPPSLITEMTQHLLASDETSETDIVDKNKLNTSSEDIEPHKRQKIN